MKAAKSSEMLVSYGIATWCYNPEDLKCIHVILQPDYYWSPS
jgi:hypothetical protein